MFTGYAGSNVLLKSCILQIKDLDCVTKIQGQSIKKRGINATRVARQVYILPITRRKNETTKKKISPNIKIKEVSAS